MCVYVFMFNLICSVKVSCCLDTVLVFVMYLL